MLKRILLSFLHLLTDLMLILFFLKFRYKPKIIPPIELTPKQELKLIKSFKPAPLVDISNCKKLVSLQQKEYNKTILDFADFDFFNLKNVNKPQLKKILKVYGVGTCGPRGFYGTLDLHLILERFLINLYYNTDIYDDSLSKTAKQQYEKRCIVYSNQFTCTNTLIACFAKTYDMIFYHPYSNESILRGIQASKCQSLEYNNIEQLTELINNNKAYNRFVLIERTATNYVQNIELKEIIALCKLNNIIIILELIFSFYLSDDLLKSVDFIIGSLTYTLCGAGSFVICDKELKIYQTLCSASYCFSASAPAILIANSIINLQRRLIIDSRYIKRFVTILKNNNKTSYTIETDKSYCTPIVFVYKEELLNYKEELLNYKEELLKLMKLKQSMIEKGYRVAIIRNPSPKIRICLKMNQSTKKLENFAIQLFTLL